MQNKIPHPIVQNHINWCWATAAKIVGLHYCKAENINPAFDWEEIHPFGIVRKDLTGLIPQYIGYLRGEVTVDAWQYKIVEQAKNPMDNPSGNFPEFDGAKIRALKYVVTGNANDTSSCVKEYGFYKDTVPLLKQECFTEIRKTLAANLALIGNYVDRKRFGHSVVLFPWMNHTVRLFDPTDGSYSTYSYSQVFETGFLTSQGQAVIQWVQYIPKQEMR